MLQPSPCFHDPLNSSREKILSQQPSTLREAHSLRTRKLQCWSLGVSAVLKFLLAPITLLYPYYVTQLNKHMTTKEREKIF